MSDDLAEWLRSQVECDETLAEDDYVQMDEDYELLVPAGKIRDAAAEITRLRAESARLREALEFYGDISKYPAPFTGGMGALWEDCGQIARAALGEKE
jgi:hypothetical protein